MVCGFNPKREARPSQTLRVQGPAGRAIKFQSQTGSQALSDTIDWLSLNVIIQRFNPKREARPSQTVWYASRVPARYRFNPKREARPSQTKLEAEPPLPSSPCFNPKREARPSQTMLHCCIKQFSTRFQSQTGSQALSDPASGGDTWTVQAVSIPNGKPGPLRRHQSRMAPGRILLFQSQTGSQALSDPPRAWQERQPRQSFNPKREARPSQTKYKFRSSS